MNKYLKKVLQEMCNRVGTSFDKIDFEKEGWFNQHTWSEEEENYFKSWFINYLLNNKEARQSLMKYPTVQYRYIKEMIDDWVFSFGWKYE